MNSYWQVLRTYLWRPRFWVLGVAYFLVVGFWFWYYKWDLPDQRQGQAIISAIYANLIVCFIALHVRRQFSHPGARMVPGYSTPHLVIAGLAGSILWLFIPLIACWVGRWSTSSVAIHASAAILMGIVACWPRGLLLIMAVPALAIWANRPMRLGQISMLDELYRGDRPIFAGTLIVLAFTMQVFASWFLTRLPRRGITTNDEFTLEAPTAPAGANPLTDWLLAMREEAAKRLTQANWLPLVQRWRAPVAIVPLLLLVPALIVAAAALFGWWLEETAAWATFALVLTCAILLLVPLAPWQSRRVAMSQEILRPVTRQRYFRQFMAAMAFDVFVWIGVASFLILVVVLSNWNYIAPANRLTGFLAVVAAGVGLVWSMAIFVYGVGVATIRWRFWLPLVAAITFVWFFGAWASIVWMGRLIAQSPRTFDQYVPSIFVGFCLVSTGIGLILALTTYRRWVRNDIA